MLGCGERSKQIDEVYKNKQTQIITFSRTLFSNENIKSKNVLDSLQSLSDKIMEDTSGSLRRPKATLFISESTNTYFRVYENPKGTIRAIGFYLSGEIVNVAEYYKNGQVMCKFSVTDDGKRNGPYTCYFEDGTYRKQGYYTNDAEVADSSRWFEGK